VKAGSMRLGSAMESASREGWRRTGLPTSDASGGGAGSLKLFRLSEVEPSSPVLRFPPGCHILNWLSSVHAIFTSAPSSRK
jgi:hypothetical protein